MSRHSQNLERLLDALTEDIFNDIECAKAVINEAGFDSTTTSSEGALKVAQLQEDTARQWNSIIVYDVGRYSVNLDLSFENTIFRICGSIPENNNESFTKALFFAAKRIGEGNDSCASSPRSSRHIDEEKLQLN